MKVFAAFILIYCAVAYGYSFVALPWLGETVAKLWR